MLDQLALLGRQRRQREQHRPLFLAAHRVSLGGLDRRPRCQSLERPVAHLIGAQPIDRAVAGDSHQPGGRSAERGAVGVDFDPGLHEHFLKHFFRLCPVSQNSEGETKQQPAMAVVQLGHRMLIAGRYPREKRDVHSGAVRSLHGGVRRNSNVPTPAVTLTDRRGD